MQGITSHQRWWLQGKKEPEGAKQLASHSGSTGLGTQCLLLCWYEAAQDVVKMQRRHSPPTKNPAVAEKPRWARLMAFPLPSCCDTVSP